MLKQSPSRNLRSKGFKVKHFLQICLFLVICIWLINQLKHFYDKKKTYEDSAGKISEKLQGVEEIVKLGRKHLHPRVDETSLGVQSREDKAELEEEIEEIKPEDAEDDGRGGGNDEMDGHDQERAEEEESEEVEDLIDVDDRERDVGSEEQENEERGNRLEYAGLTNDQAQNEGERKSHEAREENYKGDDASSSVVHDTRTLRTEFGNGGMRKIKVIIESSHRGNVNSAERGHEFDSTNLTIGIQYMTRGDANEKQEGRFNSRLMLVGNSSSLGGKDMLPETTHVSNATAIEEYKFLQVTKTRRSNSSSTLTTETDNPYN